VKIDTEKYPNLATRFNVYALPTLVLFENGKEIDRIVS
jgi:thioredoxin-like negative regulator of GroEL